MVNTPITATSTGLYFTYLFLTFNLFFKTHDATHVIDNSRTSEITIVIRTDLLKSGILMRPLVDPVTLKVRVTIDRS